MTIKVQVTQKHIDTGTVCHADSCPLALAMNDSLAGGPWLVWYNCYRSAEANATVQSSYHDLPTAAQAFVDKFDNGFRVAPFTFTLEIL